MRTRRQIVLYPSKIRALLKIPDDVHIDATESSSNPTTIRVMLSADAEDNSFPYDNYVESYGLPEDWEAPSIPSDTWTKKVDKSSKSGVSLGL